MHIIHSHLFSHATHISLLSRLLILTFLPSVNHEYTHLILLMIHIHLLSFPLFTLLLFTSPLITIPSSHVLTSLYSQTHTHSFLPSSLYFPHTSSLLHSNTYSLLFFFLSLLPSNITHLHFPLLPQITYSFFWLPLFNFPLLAVFLSPADIQQD